jgi:hypothetical protein
MPDRILFPLFGLIALAMIGAALIWPQGLGARSPGPFGHLPVQQTEAAKAARAKASQAPPELPMAPVTAGPAAPPTIPDPASNSAPDPAKVPQ